jgi:redox-sensitive bicupin YhaK (pirin superfamily)
MIHTIPNEDRYHADHGWLQTHWHFSFGDYFDPENMHWSALRVFNDDIIAPSGGFPPHPHQNMEIITLVMDGQLTHRDNLGNEGTIRPGEVQVMSAGRGITHSEFNASKTAPLHLFQLWILPRTNGLPPRWDQKTFDPFARAGQLVPIVSSGNIPGTLTIDQDAVIYLGALSTGQETTQMIRPNRKAYLFVAKGAVDLNGVALKAGDQARIADEQKLHLKATQGARLVLLDLP